MQRSLSLLTAAGVSACSPGPDAADSEAARADGVATPATRKGGFLDGSGGTRLDALEQRAQELGKGLAPLETTTPRLADIEERLQRLVKEAAERQTAAAAEKEDSRNAAASLSHAKQIALACKLYAVDYKGKFPETLWDLLPDYLPDIAVFRSPLAPTENPLDYEYYGGTDDPAKILVRDRFTTKQGW